MDLDRPQTLETARQIVTGVLSVAALLGAGLVFGACYYQAVGRVDWTVLLR